jgi:hypothetical protein
MKPFTQFPENVKKKIRYVLTDIDDTLTLNGRLPAVVFVAMEQLQKFGIRVLPITGRPDGAIILRACGRWTGWWGKTGRFISVMTPNKNRCCADISSLKASE